MRRSAVVLLMCATEAVAQTNWGSMHGAVRLPTGEPGAGATVVATSPNLAGEQAVIADEQGRYDFVSLPEGTYTVTAYLDDRSRSIGGLTVRSGSDTLTDIELGAPHPVDDITIETDERLTIDPTTAKTGLTMDEDWTRNLPVGRTFSMLLGKAPGAQTDAYGTSFAGATSPENIYLIDGMDVTDPVFGRLGLDLPNEFLIETEVMTGAYGPSYGHSTGGVVAVETKHGSNEFHGTVFGTYTPGSLASTAKPIDSPSGTIAVHRDVDRAFDLGAEVGGPIVPNHLWFHVGVDPSSQRTTATRVVQSQVDANNDGVPDVDANGVLVHTPVSSSTFPEHQTTYYFTAAIDGALDPNNQFRLQAFGNPSTGTTDNLSSGTFAPGDILEHTASGAYDLSASYTGSRDDRRTQFDARIGFHRGYAGTTPTNDLERLPLTRYHSVRGLATFADLEGSAIAACDESSFSDPYPKIALCPVVDYTESGLGVVDHRTDDRWSAAMSVTRLAQLAGRHSIKAGAEIDVSTDILDESLTGGYELTQLAFPITWQVEQFGRPSPSPLPFPGITARTVGSCGDFSCETTDSRRSSTTDQNLGAYIQDTWEITSQLTVTGGLRFDRQVVGVADQIAGLMSGDGTPVPSTAFTLDNLAPRIGAIYAPTNDGRSKLFAHWGRYFERVPMDINERSFGGQVNVREQYGIVNIDNVPRGTVVGPPCVVDHMPGVVTSDAVLACGDPTVVSVTNPQPQFVAPDLRGQHTDELVAGAEFQPEPSIRLGVTYTHRAIGDVIEDMSTDGGNTLFVANPGRDYTAQAADLAAQAAAVMTTQPLLAFHLAQEAQELAHAQLDTPSRNYDAVTVRVDDNPTSHSMIRASYTYSALRGNYSGLYSTETNQLDPNITSQFDLQELTANRYGRLGLDRPHRAEIDGYYRYDLDRHDALTFGASLRGQSGIPHNALGSHAIYGASEVYLLPRGSIQRSPFTTQLDVHLAYRRRLTSAIAVEAFADIFNLFDKQDELSVDENYTSDVSEPIVGGDMTDLAHLKNHRNGVQTGTTVTPSKSFDHTSVVTQPRTVRLGVRLTF